MVSNDVSLISILKIILLMIVAIITFKLKNKNFNTYSSH